MRRLDKEVIHANIKPCDADLLVSTAHTAKGLEWPYVHVLGDAFFNLAKVAIGPPTAKTRETQPPGSLTIASFEFPDYGDDVNLWYVAVTRAKKVLSLPPEFMLLVHDLNKVRLAVEDPNVYFNEYLADADAPSQMAHTALEHARSPADMRLIYDHIYVPLRNEQGAAVAGGLCVDGTSYFE